MYIFLFNVKHIFLVCGIQKKTFFSVKIIRKRSKKMRAEFEGQKLHMCTANTIDEYVITAYRNMLHKCIIFLNVHFFIFIVLFIFFCLLFVCVRINWYKHTLTKKSQICLYLFFSLFSVDVFQIADRMMFNAYIDNRNIQLILTHTIHRFNKNKNV